MKRLFDLSSLRTRLIIALLIGVALLCVAWTVGVTLSDKREEIGEIDTDLRRAAMLALMSVPRGIVATDETEAFVTELPVSTVGDMVSLQVWDLKNGRLVMRTPRAPKTPLVEDFSSGFADAQIAADRWRIYAVSDSTSTVQVQAGRTQDQILAQVAWDAFRNFKVAVSIFFGLLLAICLVVWITFRPMRRLGVALQRRDPLDFEPIALDNVPTELHPFITAVNTLQTRQAEALRRERNFIADAAHELRTPLAVLTTRAELAIRTNDAEQRGAALHHVLAGTRRASRLAEQLLDHAQLDAPESARLEDVDLGSLVSMEVREFEERARRKRQSVKLDAQPTPIRANVDALGILISNLLDNAWRHAPAEARIEIDCHQNVAGDVELTVRDDGIGIPAEETAKVFERFYRSTRSTDSGSGIGLALVARIAHLHHARIIGGPGIDGRGWGITIVFPGRLTSEHGFDRTNGLLK